MQFHPIYRAPEKNGLVQENSETIMIDNQCKDLN